ncbi:MAG: LysM domain protein, partial [Proteobacteria bacterium]|nr:LysM domain protein [Pseudomonadota bacterium]
GDGVYIRTIGQANQRGYTVFRPGKPYRDGVTGEILGYEALYVAEGELQAGGDPATLQLTQTDREVVIGDRIMPVETEKLQMNYEPHAPKKLIRGHIISVVDGVTQIGQYQVVIIDRGLADGMETGHVLDILKRSRSERDIVSSRVGELTTLPEEKAGVLMIFQPFERVSFGLIMNATRAIHVNDVVQTP